MLAATSRPFAQPALVTAPVAAAQPPPPPPDPAAGVPEIVVDRGINAGQGGPRTNSPVEEEQGGILFGQASPAGGLCFTSGLVGTDCCMSARNSSTCARRVAWRVCDWRGVARPGLAWVCECGLLSEMRGRCRAGWGT